MSTQLPTKSSSAEGTSRLIAGLPSRIVVIYGLLFVIAFGAYALIWRRAPLVVGGDSREYLEAAQDLSDGSIDQLNDRSPGFPLLLVLTRSFEHPKRILFYTSLVLYFATIWLLASILHAAGLSGKMLVGFCLFLLLPPYVENTGYVMSENLAQFCLALSIAGLVFWFRKRNIIWLFVSALAIAYSALTRPTYQVLAFVIAGCLLLLPVLYRHGQLKFKDMIVAGAVLIVMSIAIIGGYSYVNFRKFGYFGVTPRLGFHLSTKTALFVERLPEQDAEVRELLVRARDRSLVGRGSSHTGAAYIFDVRPELQLKTGLGKADLSRYLERLNLTLIRQAPMDYLLSVARALASYWFPSSGSLSIMNSRILQLLWATLHFFVMGAFALQLIVLAGVKVYYISSRLVNRDDPPVTVLQAPALPVLAYLLTGLIIFYTMILTCMVDVGDPRQRAADALLVFMTVLGFLLWWNSLASHKRPGPSL